MKILLVGVLAAVSSLPTGPPALAASPYALAAGIRTRVVASADLGAASYWTVSRMAHATPLGRRTDEGLPEPAVPTARAVPGSRVIGALFFNNGAGGHYCTASVIRTPKRNMLLTAAHCLYNQATHTWHRHIVFVPGYRGGHRPYGTWPVWLMVADKRWIERGDPNLDYGFAAVQIMRGRRLADVVSDSWYLKGTENTMDAATVAAYEQVFEQGAAEGIGFYFGTGDAGDQAFTQPQPGWDGRPHVNYPASDPWVTAVGGTSLAVDGNNRRSQRLQFDGRRAGRGRPWRVTR